MTRVHCCVAYQRALLEGRLPTPGTGAPLAFAEADAAARQSCIHARPRGEPAGTPCFFVDPAIIYGLFRPNVGFAGFEGEFPGMRSLASDGGRALARRDIHDAVLEHGGYVFSFSVRRRGGKQGRGKQRKRKVRFFPLFPVKHFAGSKDTCGADTMAVGIETGWRTFQSKRPSPCFRRAMVETSRWRC